MRWSTVFREYAFAAFVAAGIALGVCVYFVSQSAANLIFAAVAIGCGMPIVLSTFRNMLRGQFVVDTVAAMAIIGSIALGEYLAGALVVLMQSGGEAIEDYGLRQANKSLDNLLRRAPSKAHRKRDGEFEDVAASSLHIGDSILIRPGDIIAADGTVIEGQGGVDESALTGEPVPLTKLPGDKVFSGTINLSGSFLVRTTSTAAESKYELIVKMVQAAQGNRAPINRLANQYTPFFTVLTILMTVLTAIVAKDYHRALAVLVVATPCPLIIATPLAVISAINRAAFLNIIVKSGAAIEQAGTVKTVVFDKTGTLTSGQPTLASLTIFPDQKLKYPDRDVLLQNVSCVELLSVHVLADAVLKSARSKNLVTTAASEVHELPGSGVSGVVNGRRIAIGSGTFLRSLEIPIPEEANLERASLSEQGKTVAFFAVDQDLVGMLIFEDRIRPESRKLMDRLKRLGLSVPVMLTGDSAETAESVASQIGITEVRSRLKPEDKLKAMNTFALQGSVMMVGDGINDAPALAAADVGVAMGGYGAGIATDAADIVITVENVERVADIIEIGRRMLKVAKQGIFFGIGASLLLMTLAGLGYIRPAPGALLQEGLDLITILNALRAR